MPGLMIVRFAVVLLIISALLGLSGCGTAPATVIASLTSTSTLTRTHTPGPTVTPLASQSIPDVPTSAATPQLVALPSTTPPSPDGTSFFPLPTQPPAQTATLAVNCADVYALQTVLRMVGEEWTIDQVIAAYGQPQNISGRPPMFRFEAFGCTLRVMVGPRFVQRVELVPYFSLGELVARYGEPAAVAEVAASIALPGRERLALLYPEVGLVALFEDSPLNRSALVSQAFVLPPADLDTILDALGSDTQLIEDWQLPFR